MPLSEPAARAAFHHRTVSVSGYRREDGLWDVEAALVDAKAYDYKEGLRGEMPSGRPIHHMAIRATVDDSLVIRAIEVATDAYPYPTCGEAASQLEQVIGEQIGSGWRDRVRRKLNRAENCIHLLELLDQLATVAFQTIESGHAPQGKDPMAAYSPKASPFFVNGCLAWREGGPMMLRYFPQTGVQTSERDDAAHGGKAD
jgi:hypothetical protein